VATMEYVNWVLPSLSFGTCSRKEARTIWDLVHLSIRSSSEYQARLDYSGFHHAWFNSHLNQEILDSREVLSEGCASTS